jgi:hypothetical protein
LNQARTPIVAIWIAATALSLAACGERVEAGLANAPSMQRSSRPRSGHDVIANGDESCPRSASGTDPLVNRIPPCNEEGVDDAGTNPPPDGSIPSGQALP